MKKLLLTLAVSLVGMFAASADELASITLTKSTFVSGVSSYTSSWNATDANANSWTLNNFNNNNKGWDFVKCITKKATNGTAYIQTDFPVAGTVNEVVLNAKRGCVVTGTIKVLTASTKAFTESKEVGSIAISLETSAADVKIPVSATAADQYVRILFTGTNNTTTNGAVWVYSVKINGTPAGETPLKPANLRFSEPEVVAELSGTFNRPDLTMDTNAPVVYTSSNTNVAEVNSTTGEVKLKKIGTTVITAETTENKEYAAGFAQYTLEVVNSSLEAIFTSDFANGLEGYTTDNVVLPEGATNVWSTGTNGGVDYAKASGYISGKNNAADAWLITPKISLISIFKPVLEFDQVYNFFTGIETAKAETKVMIRSTKWNDQTKQAETSDWTELTCDSYPTAMGWTPWVNSGAIDLSAYEGTTIELGFHYTSTADKAGTWEIANLRVLGEPDSSGVEDVEVEAEALVEYYNLQGVQVENPANGIFIRRQGNSVSKVYIR